MSTEIHQNPLLSTGFAVNRGRLQAAFEAV